MNRFPPLYDRFENLVAARRQRRVGARVLKAATLVADNMIESIRQNPLDTYRFDVSKPPKHIDGELFSIRVGSVAERMVGAEADTGVTYDHQASLQRTDAIGTGEVHLVFRLGEAA
jgi:hypothetical protein